MAPAPDASADLGRRTFLAATAFCIALHLLALALLARELPHTRDEYPYLKAGAILRLERSWDVGHTTFHGPLPFYANQVAASLGVAPVEPAADYMTYGRLGMLSFALVAAIVVVGLTNRLFGRRAALAALLLHAANPVVLANAPLLTCDMALAAFYGLVVWCACAWLQSPSRWRWLAFAFALGASLATKYLALFLLPVLGVAFLCEAGRGRSPWFVSSDPSRRASTKGLDAALAVALLAVIALLTLHTCYLWSVPGYVAPAPLEPAVAAIERGAGPRSALLRRLLQWPLVPQLLQLVPEPFVRGVDFQKMQAEGAGLTALGDRLAPGHPSYFALSLFTKLPLAMLFAIGLGLVRGRRWPARAPVLLSAALLLPLVYLSFFSVLQSGIRYLLPTVVLLGVLGGRGVAWAWERARVGRVLVLVGVLALLWCHVITWPHYTSAFNVLAGDRPYLLFADANLDWSAGGAKEGLDFAAAHRDAKRIPAALGPAFGSYVVNATELAPADPRDGTRVYHWLRRFHPTARQGAWCRFDVDAPAFMHADAASAPRSKVEFAIALLGAERFDEALAAVDGVEDRDAPAVRAAVELHRQGKDVSPEFCQILLLMGRGDRVARQGSGATRYQCASALWATREVKAMCDLLEGASPSQPLTAPEAFLLAAGLATLHQHERAFALLDQHAPVAGSPERAAYDAARRALAADVDAWRQLIAR